MSVNSRIKATKIIGQRKDSLPIEYFPLNYDLSDFKPRINSHHLTVGFLSRFPVCFNLFELLFLVIPCLVGSSALYRMKNITKN